MGNVKTYVRPMGAWWRRNPFYGWYMVRELSCVFVTGYALVLLVGLTRLVQGEPAYEAWRESMARPSALLFHLIALVLVTYHSWTWFKVMPKTLPFLTVGGRRISDQAIVISGVAAAVMSTALVLLAVTLVAA